MEVLTCVQPVVTQETRSLFLTVKRSVIAAGLVVTNRRHETTSNDRLPKLAKELYTDLNNQVYSAKGKSVIDQTRVVLDLQSIGTEA